MHNLIMGLLECAEAHGNRRNLYTSGILIEKRDVVAKAIEKGGFEIREITEDGEWCVQFWVAKKQDFLSEFLVKRQRRFWMRRFLPVLIISDKTLL